MLDFTVATVTACYQQRRRMYACVPIFPLTIEMYQKKKCYIFARHVTKTTKSYINVCIIFLLGVFAHNILRIWC